MIKTDIILHPHKILMDSYFNEDTSSYFFGESNLSPSETIALGSIIAAYHPQRIIRIPEVNIPINIKTPDFLVDNMCCEIKCPEKLSGVRSLARKAFKQIRCNGLIVFEFMNSKGATLSEYIEKAYSYCAHRQNINLILMNHGNIIYSTLA